MALALFSSSAMLRITSGPTEEIVGAGGGEGSVPIILVLELLSLLLDLFLLLLWSLLLDLDLLQYYLYFLSLDLGLLSLARS